MYEPVATDSFILPVPLVITMLDSADTDVYVLTGAYIALSLCNSPLYVEDPLFFFPFLLLENVISITCIHIVDERGG